MRAKVRRLYESRIGKNSIFAIAEQFLTLSLNLFITILFARHLGAEVLGQYNFSLTLVGIISIFSHFGIATIINREIAKSTSKSELYLGNAIAIKLFISIPLTLIFSLSVGVVLNFSSESYWILFFVAIYHSLLTTIGLFSGAVVSLHRSDIVLKINVYLKLSSLLLLLVLLYMKFGLYEILFGYIILEALVLLYAVYQTKRLCNFHLRFDQRFAKTMILISLPLVFSAGAEFVALKGDVILLGIYLDKKEIGYYTAAYSIFLASTLLPLAITKVAFPNFVEYFHADSDKAKALINKLSCFFLFYSMVVFFVLFWGSKIIADVFFGKTFDASSKVIKVLAFAVVFIVLNRLYNYVLLGLKQNNYYFRITFAGMIVNLMTNMLLIPSFGINGAAVATVVSEAVTLALAYKRVSNV